MKCRTCGAEIKAIHPDNQIAFPENQEGFCSIECRERAELRTVETTSEKNSLIRVTTKQPEKDVVSIKKMIDAHERD